MVNYGIPSNTSYNPFYHNKGLNQKSTYLSIPGAFFQK